MRSNLVRRDGQRVSRRLPILGEKLETLFLGMYEEQLVERIPVRDRSLQFARGVAGLN